MANATRFGNVPLIADTTVLCKLRHASTDLLEDFRAAARAGLIGTSPVVCLEYLHHASSRAEFDAFDARLRAFPLFDLNERIGNEANLAMRRLKDSGSDGNHRVSAPDALIAATADVHGVNVLHDDKHYEKLATVLDFTPIRFKVDGA